MPTLAPLLDAAPAVQAHVAVALIALVLAPVILIRRKGGSAHRWLGRVWVLAMAGTALTSFWVQDIRLWGPWSPIHLLSVLTLVTLVFGLRAAIRRNIALHRQIMENLACWALGVTGLFTLLPGRTMNVALFGGESLAGFGGTVLAVVVLWLGWRAGPRLRILGIGFQRGVR